MKVWDVYPVISGPMPFQLALDEILFLKSQSEYAGSPILRFYFSSEPWITTGYSDCGPFPEGAKISKRITGGGRVQHGTDLLFTLVAHKDDDESFKSVRVSYWKIHEAVKNAFEKMGEKIRFYRCDEKLPRGGECFVYPIATDLELDGKKVAGGAQKRSLGVMLHQESILLPPRLDAFAFLEMLKIAIQDLFKVKLNLARCSPEDLTAAKHLASEKYEVFSAAGCMSEILK